LAFGQCRDVVPTSLYFVVGGVEVWTQESEKGSVAFAEVAVADTAPEMKSDGPSWPAM